MDIDRNSASLKHSREFLTRYIKEILIETRRLRSVVACEIVSHIVKQL